MDTVRGVQLPNGEVFEIEDPVAREYLGLERGSAEYVTPQMYGAKGDGETDDFKAFEKMFAEVPKNVYIPAGDYIISKAITIPEGVKRIKGAGKDVTRIISSKSVFTTGGVVLYGLVISELTTTNNDAGAAFTGGFRYCSFIDVTIWECKYGFDVNLSSWSNTFTRCTVSHCKYALRLMTSETNNNIFRDCHLENNNYVLYTEKSSKNIVFDGCLIQNNEIGFRTCGMSAFVIRASYIENNACAFEIHTACYGSTWTIENSFIYSDSATNGWLLNLPSITTTPNQNIPMFHIEKCYIRHASSTYKPFAFYKAETNGQSGPVAVNVNDCMFYHQPNSYIELFDLADCSLYGSGWNRLPIKTDLVYYQTDTCKWFLRSGNGSKYFGEDRYFELFGYLVPDQKNSTEDLDGVNVEIPSIVGKVENAYLGGSAVMETYNSEGAEQITNMCLDNATIGGLHFKFPNGGQCKIREKLYVTGLRY